ncbi:hypothetical protein TCAL_15158 [Tigriopus californicus]|uniref:MYND-type domain-containing protein n=1 Tax=Tigriopus californicus TaxID=6832 RepID=A0A553NVU2_TIGCA|nr:hypothetical protein TCAL_15158 [Tigriopus californicus]
MERTLGDLQAVLQTCMGDGLFEDVEVQIVAHLFTEEQRVRVLQANVANRIGERLDELPLVFGSEDRDNQRTLASHIGGERDTSLPLERTNKGTLILQNNVINARIGDHLNLSRTRIRKDLQAMERTLGDLQAVLQTCMGDGLFEDVEVQIVAHLFTEEQRVRVLQANVANRIAPRTTQTKEEVEDVFCSIPPKFGGLIQTSENLRRTPSGSSSNLESSLEASVGGLNRWTVNSMAVCGLLKFYLAQILNEDVISIVFGVLLWDPNARQGEDPFKTKLRLYLGQEDGLPETVKHNFKIFREYGNDVHIEKFVIFAFECSDLNPCVRMYDILMREYFKNHYQVEINSLEHKWERQCWNCFKVWEDPSLLKTCVKCKRAKYCGQSCQQSEWKMHKLLHKELELAREILTKDEDDN